MCHNAVRHRAAPTGSNQRRQAAAISLLSQSPVAVTRTSLAGGAVVPSTNRCRPRRALAMKPSSTRRSTAGRHVDTKNAGPANTISSTNAGWTEPSSRAVMTRRNSQPSVANSDMNMWSSANTWSRSIASRSRYSGRSWCSIVGTIACRRATCDSSAIATRSRKRRCTRCESTDRYHVAVTDAASPTPAVITAELLPSMVPSTINFSHSASSASGSIISSARPSDSVSSLGSAR